MDRALTSRRRLLHHAGRVAAMLAAAGLLPTPTAAQSAAYDKAAFEATSMDSVMKALGVAAPVASKAVVLTVADIADNGAAVPVGISSSLPGVTRLLLLVEKNPAMLSAMFEVSDAVDPEFEFRVKMAESSFVYAVAMLADGRTLFTAREVKVTLGGCA